MNHFPKQSPIRLQQRLRGFIGKSVAITANGLSLEPGILTKVLQSTFIIVQNERFVPLSTNTIHVINIPKARRFTPAGVRTTFDAGGLFDDIQLIRIGSNFIEVQRSADARGRYFIPLNKVVGLFRI